MTETLQYQIEELIDSHGLAGVARAIAETCYEKSEHVQSNYGDKQLAREWTKAGKLADKLNYQYGLLAASMSAVK